MSLDRQFQTRLGPLHVRVTGDGPPAVLWPSLFVDGGSWRRIEHGLAARRTLVLIDGPGHGASGDPGRRYTTAECVDAAFEVLDALAIDGPVDWVGNAWGGHVGILATTSHARRLRSLVSISAPVAAYTATERRRTHFLLAAYGVLGPARFIRAAVVETLLAPATRTDDPEAVAYVDGQIRDADRRHLRNAVQSISLGRPDLANMLPRIGVPTLFVTGTDDTGFTPHQAAEAITHVPGGVVAIVADAAYLPPLERPRETARLILDFWAGVR
jgi:pimeloyl-ACP methyl ester carboxylesterase